MPLWVETVILGIVEGITEFLPISSTGHLIICQALLENPRSEFFNIGIQSGAILAVVFVYWRKLWDLLITWREPESFDYISKISVAFFVTVVLGLTLKAFEWELPEELEPVAWAVFIGALVIFAAEYYLQHTEQTDKISWLTAVVVGAAQVLAGVFPGTSRSGATIFAAMFMGVSRMRATEFSFILGIPTMFAATAYATMALIKEEGTESIIAEMDQFIIGFLVSMVVAFVAVKWLLAFLQSNTFVPFAWYRLFLGLGLLAWLYFGAPGV